MAAGRRSSPLLPLVLGAALLVLFVDRWVAWVDPAPGSRALHELERMALLPAGAVELQGFSASSYARWEFAEPLLIDLFEVTRADWEHYLAPPVHDPRWTLPEAVWSPDRRDWPAYLSHAQAVHLAEARGMRLPTAREWIYAAVGEVGHRYPWGQGQQTSIANTLELGLSHPAPVGSFESGRSPFGCYDMVGNVREWVAEPPPLSDNGEAIDADETRAWLMGGSYRDRLYSIFYPAPRGERGVPAFFAEDVDVEAVDVRNGARLCAPAREYLWTHAAEWGEGEDVGGRLRAVGQRWMEAGGSASAQLLVLLEELVARPGAPPGLGLLLSGAQGT